MGLLPITLDATTEPEGNDMPPGGGDTEFINGYGYFIKIDKPSRTVCVWFMSAFIGGVTPYLKLIAMIRALTEDHTLHLYIHSPGGEIATCCNIINALQNTKAQVIMYNLGLAASCGSLMLVAADKIYIAPNATTMFHSAGVGLGGLVHRVVTRTNHTISYVEKMLFEPMKEKGLLTEEEHEAITKRGEEFFITSDVMESRLRAKGIWYEGGGADV